eukprot:UN0164
MNQLMLHLISLNKYVVASCRTYLMIVSLFLALQLKGALIIPLLEKIIKLAIHFNLVSNHSSQYKFVKESIIRCCIGQCNSYNSFSFRVVFSTLE